MIVKRTGAITKFKRGAGKFFKNKIVPALDRLMVDEEETVVRKIPKNGVDLALFSNKRK
jgi:hypothetical protein